MKKPGTFLFAFVALAVACAGQGPGDGSSRVAAEIERLRQTAAGKPSAAANWKETAPAVERVLARAARNAGAGRLYLALEDLAAARNALRAMESVEEPPAGAAADLAGFEKAWTGARAELAALDRTARGWSWGRTPAAVRALAESEQGKSLIVADASRAYAGVSGVAEGLYGLGEARAAMESASFLHSLGLATAAAPLPLRSLEPELDRFQERVNTVFQPPRSIELHSRFIRLNAALKLAGDLDAAGLHAGALYQYLDAVQQLALLDVAAPDEAGRTRLREAAAAARGAAGRQRDDSLLVLFLERADAAMAGPPDAPPTPDDWKKAAAIVEQVLPAYQEVLRAPKPPATRMASALTVTLVRWPYT